MYIPAHYHQKDQEKLLAFMREYSFATLVSVQENRPFGTHLPFVTEERDGKIFLLSHMARANSQWKEAQTQQVLVIFQEPHAYISPSHYNKLQNVPTWNYTAVHAYGHLTLVEPLNQAQALLEKMIDAYEPAYKAQWHQLPDAFKTGLTRGIVAFEIEVTELQGKEKLSQNKALEERQRIAEYLKAQEDSTISTVGKLMDSTF
ncbi:FMN-binding negative transcriptional regulator [Sabulibacter ruber]|uniref:FMN-binding negative transcriptional regulator n=1 Tax=Sabulibacter ruber TaxID=2811901 RepID=UPI001A975335|nr:FMN-binding negative transcriptional regulator [Sabulibacter ruber]